MRAIHDVCMLHMLYVLGCMLRAIRVGCMLRAIRVGSMLRAIRVGSMLRAVRVGSMLRAIRVGSMLRAIGTCLVRTACQACYFVFCLFPLVFSYLIPGIQLSYIGYLFTCIQFPYTVFLITVYRSFNYYYYYHQ